VRHLATDLAWQLHRQRQQARTLWLRVVQQERSVMERRRAQREPVFATSSVEQGLKKLLAQVRITAGVIELTALAADLVPLSEGSRQLELWQEPRDGASHFHEALPYLRSRFGTDRFWQVSLDDDATSITRAVRYQPLSSDDE
jgi:hypothetical protein